ncbi:Pet18 [Kluyveromyces lactis]|nr:Pet18 [Kluyveromyces lactis]
MSTTERLINANRDLLQSVTNHILPKELCNGTLSDDVLYIYCAQDKKFFILALRLLAFYSSRAPSEEALLRLCKQVGFLAGEENDYFDQCLQLTERDPLKRFKTQVLPKVQKYLDFLEKMPASVDYGQWVTHMWCAEYVYWKWAHHLPRSDKLEWKHKEWIKLHDGDHFEEWCNFLAGEVDKLQYEDVSRIFVTTLELEKDFFDSCLEATK